MPTWFLIPLFIIVGLYTVLVLAATLGRLRLPSRPPSSEEMPFVSVVIAARNEADGIADCVERVLDCDYPEDRREVIVVDDFSTDGTAEQVRSLQPVFPDGDVDANGPLRLIRMADLGPDTGGHKVAAVTEGVHAAHGDVILTTDADCRVRPGWIRSMAPRCTPATPFVAGPVRYDYGFDYFERLQSLYFAGLVSFGAGLIGLGTPAYCNSANVAMRRDVYEALDGVPDGAARDEMMLQHVAYATDRDVTFALDRDATVTTDPESSFSGFMSQQIRWASMGLRYPFWLPRAMVFLLWLTHTAVLLALAVALVLPEWRQPALAALLLKFAANAATIIPFQKQQDDGDLLRSMVPTQLFMVGVIPFVGFLSFFQDVRWKGRVVE